MMTDKTIYLLHNSAYESQCGESDTVEVYDSIEGARAKLDECTKPYLKLPSFKRSDDDASWNCGDWFYRCWIDKVPIHHFEDESKSEGRKLLDRYIEASAKCAQLQNMLFPTLREICEITNEMSALESITNAVIETSDSFPEPQVMIYTQSRYLQNHTYNFPLRYLEMSLADIRTELETDREKERKEHRKQMLELARQEYEYWKARVESEDE